jgi:hypothetical protein
MLSSPGSGGCESAARLGGYRLALEEVATRFRHFHRISLRPGVTREFLQLDPSRFLDRDSNKCAIPGDDIARGVGVLGESRGVDQVGGGGGRRGTIQEGHG